jgi:hypothetical protein
MTNEARRPAYLELCRILMEEEIPFQVTDCSDIIDIKDTTLTVSELYTIFGAREDLKKATSPRWCFAVMKVDEAFVEIQSHRTSPQPGDTDLSLRVTFLVDE